LTLSLADEYARAGIRVNAVTPGYIKTEMTESVNPEAKATWEDKIPLKRIGEGSEVGEAVLFLASDASSYITGQTLGVDGGWFRR
jgi:3-oxoacyl-[acyl-carrier protein] reductase